MTKNPRKRCIGFPSKSCPLQKGRSQRDLPFRWIYSTRSKSCTLRARFQDGLEFNQAVFETDSLGIPLPGGEKTRVTGGRRTIRGSPDNNQFFSGIRFASGDEVMARNCPVRMDDEPLLRA